MPAPATRANPPHRFTLEWADLPGGPDDSLVDDPTPDDVEAILGVLAEAAGNGSSSGFVILSTGPEHFLQAAVPSEPGASMIVEYRAGRADSHMVIDEDIFGPRRLKELFAAYMKNPGAIGRAAKWRRFDD